MDCPALSRTFGGEASNPLAVGLLASEWKPGLGDEMVSVIEGRHHYDSPAVQGISWMFVFILGPLLGYCLWIFCDTPGRSLEGWQMAVFFILGLAVLSGLMGMIFKSFGAVIMRAYLSFLIVAIPVWFVWAGMKAGWQALLIFAPTGGGIGWVIFALRKTFFLPLRGGSDESRF